MIVTNILEATLTMVGNASSAAVSHAVQSDFVTQFQINGKLVFNGIHHGQFHQGPYLQVQ